MDARDVGALHKLADNWEDIADVIRSTYRPLGDGYASDPQASTAITVLKSCATGLRELLEVLNDGR